MIAFLQAVKDKPHPDYFPAEVRAMVIREAFEGRDYRLRQRKKLFPELDKGTSAKGVLGDY